MEQQLVNDINEAQVSMVILSKLRYNEEKIDLTKVVIGRNSKICYITISKPYNTVIKEIEKTDMDTNKIVFIDAVSGGKKDLKNCIFVSSPSNITEISIAFSKLMKQFKFDISLIDSIDALAIYTDEKTLIKFVHDIVTKIRVSNSKIVFIISSDKEASETTKELYMFMDNVINFAS